MKKIKFIVSFMIAISAGLVIEGSVGDNKLEKFKEWGKCILNESKNTIRERGKELRAKVKITKDKYFKPQDDSSSNTKIGEESNTSEAESRGSNAVGESCGATGSIRSNYSSERDCGVPDGSSRDSSSVQSFRSNSAESKDDDEWPDSDSVLINQNIPSIDNEDNILFFDYSSEEEEESVGGSSDSPTTSNAENNLRVRGLKTKKYDTYPVQSDSSLNFSLPTITEESVEDQIPIDLQDDSLVGEGESVEDLSDDAIFSSPEEEKAREIFHTNESPRGDGDSLVTNLTNLDSGKFVATSPSQSLESDNRSNTFLSKNQGFPIIKILFVFIIGGIIVAGIDYFYPIQCLRKGEKESCLRRCISNLKNLKRFLTFNKQAEQKIKRKKSSKKGRGSKLLLKTFI